MRTFVKLVTRKSSTWSGNPVTSSPWRSSRYRFLRPGMTRRIPVHRRPPQTLNPVSTLPPYPGSFKVGRWFNPLRLQRGIPTRPWALGGQEPSRWWQTWQRSVSFAFSLELFERIDVFDGSIIKFCKNSENNLFTKLLNIVYLLVYLFWARVVKPKNMFTKSVSVFCF